jgi:small subunit ribosomal protein S8
MIMDPIADLFTRIRNGYMAHLEEVQAPHSKMKESVLEVLHATGFIGDYKVEEVKGRRVFVVALKYDGRRPAITKIERISTPGRRMYVGVKEIPTILGGMGTAILSTPSGIMTGKEARTKKVGGELLGRVW